MWAPSPHLLSHTCGREKNKPARSSCEPRAGRDITHLMARSLAPDLVFALEPGLDVCRRDRLRTLNREGERAGPE